MRARCWPLLLAFAVGDCAAWQIETLSVERDGDDYRVRLLAHIDAPPERVFAQLADLSALPRLNPSVTRVQIGERDAEGRLPVYSESEFCVLMVCRSLRHQQSLLISPDVAGGRIDARTEPPPASDFRRGQASWQVDAEEGGSRFRFEASLSPAIWLPPVVGPRMVAHRLREETRVTVEQLERLSREAGP